MEEAAGLTISKKMVKCAEYPLFCISKLVFLRVCILLCIGLSVC
jgi:hypothetical protein